MYRLLRNTHLLLGLFFCWFVLVYGISSVHLSHPSWLPLQRETTESRFEIPSAQAGDARSVARYLMREHSLHGVLQDIEETEDGFDFEIARLGTVQAVSYRRLAGSAHVKTSTPNFIGWLVALHHRAGLDSGYWLHVLWGWIVGLTSFALLALGASGIYLWFKAHTERVIGTVLLGASLTVGVGLVILIRFA